MDSDLRKYKDHWIRCVAMPQRDRGNTWDCVVYVFVSEPSRDFEPAGDSCFQTVLHGLSSEGSALTSGLEHARNLVDSSQGATGNLQ